MKQKTVFFRNDDVRECLDQELITLVDIFSKANVPISLAVEPANVTQEVVNWLLEKKKTYPDLIELIQHGYDHNKNLKYPKGSEFGKTRTFEDQYADIQKGKQLMNKYFKDEWFPAMAFPYGCYNAAALTALDKSAFLLMTSSVTFTLPHQVKNSIGRITQKDFILGKKVSYHNHIRKPYSFVEYNTSVNIIKKYITEETADHFSLEDVIEQVKYASKKTSFIGVLFHHRFHTAQLTDIAKLLEWLKQNNYAFSTLGNLYANFKK